MHENNDKIRAVIIDDEPNCCDILEDMVTSECPDVIIDGIYNNASTAIEAIRSCNPHVVFLDVEMPRMNGFEMLEQLEKINFHLIFTTSYDQYALKAFRFSALDYLLKPVDREEFKLAIDKLRKRLHVPLPQQLEILMKKIKQPSAVLKKIAIPTMEGLELISIDQVIRCESNDNYSTLFLKNAKKLLVTRSLKEMEETLEPYSFLRVHRFFLVNINEIEKYVKGEGGYLVMSDKSIVDVAKSRKEILLNKIVPR